MDKTFYSNGKLLLTAEYLVLDGAKALAIPTMYGQSLNVKARDKEGINWKSRDENGSIWFEDNLYLRDNNFLAENIYNPISKTLVNILNEAKKLNPEFLKTTSGLEITTSLDFNRNWGLGSSSTLINNIALWSQTDAFKLLERSFGGSGYDIACAATDTPLLYSNADGKLILKPIKLKWDFKDELFFVFLNKKQDSKEGIKSYKVLSGNLKGITTKINSLTEAFLNASTLFELEDIITAHEDLISNLLNLSKVKKKFPDYPGNIKSLGAWGGDFILVTRKGAQSYFPARGYDVVIPFREMIK